MVVKIVITLVRFSNAFSIVSKFIEPFEPHLIIALLDLSITFSARTNVPSKPKTEIIK